MFKVLCVIVIVAQIAAAKKKPTSLEVGSKKVSAFLKDVQDFFGDMVEAITDMLGFGETPSKKKKKTSSDWSTDLFKYMRKSVRSGYKTLKNAIPILDMARATIDDVGPILPNITTAEFIQRLLYQIVPDLMEKPPENVIVVEKFK